MWPRRLSASAAIFLAVLGLAGIASAASGATTDPPRALSDYEKQSIRLALQEVDGELEPHPEGKRVEGIDVVSLEVIEHRDPLPGFVNVLHTTTRPEVIEREILLKTGDPYDPVLVDESERNLRGIPQISVALIVATKGRAPGTVRLLAVTKDVWSLRPEAEPVFFNGKLQTLVMAASEENLLGRHKIVTANIALFRANYLLGLGYTDPRIGGSRLQMDVDANLVFNCRTGGVEGTNGDFTYGKPLYSTHTKWGWMTGVLWNEGIVRPAGTLGQSVCSGDHAVELDFVATPVTDHVPYQYRQDIVQGEVGVVRSFGTLFKNDIAFGLEANRRAFEPPDLTGEPKVVREDFQKLLPVNDTRISPFVQLHSFQTQFQRLLDGETLGLQEDYRLGYDAWLRAYPAAKALGSTRTLFGLYAGLGYTLPISDGYARAVASTNLQFSQKDQSDAYAQGALRFVTPRMPFGRVVFDGEILDRFENYLNPSYSLGGTTRLRGYRTQAFVGPNVLVGNIEVRSRPIEIFSVQIGAAAFYDIGDAFHDFGTLKLKQGAGGGLRFVFPQAQRTVFRVDLGVPLDPGDPAAETTVIAAFEQAFPVPSLGSPGLVL